MKNVLLLFVILVLAAAVWLLLHDDGGPAGGGSAGGSYIESGPGEGPTLHADGTPSKAGGIQAPPVAPPPVEPAGERVTWNGRVVDERRHPVAGANVELRAGARVLARTVSDAQGRFVVAPAATRALAGERGALVGRTADGRAGTVSVWITERGGAQQELPVLVLRRASTLEVRVVREGAGVLGARVTVVRRASGVPLPLASADADENGRASFPAVPDGAYEVYAAIIGHGRGLARVRLPREEGAGPLDVELTAERLLEVRVVDAVTRRAVVGAEVHVGDTRTMPEPHGPGYLPPAPAPRTDRSGRVTVRRLAAGETVYVNVTAPGYAQAPWWRSRAQAAGPEQGTVEVALQRRRSVRFPVVEDDVPAPGEGAVLRVESRAVRRGGDAAGVRARMEGGFVVADGLDPGTVAGTFVAPDGSQAPFQAAAGVEEGTTVTFRRPRIVQVRVVEPDGAPVAGLGLRLKPIGRLPPVAPATTDETGVARFVGVAAERATVHLLQSDQPFGGPLLGTLDLAREDEVHELVLQAGVEVVLSLRIADEPRLPASYSLLLAGQRLDPATVDEQPSGGELMFTVRPPVPEGEVRLELHAEGFLREAIVFDAADPGPVERTLELRPAGKLVVRVQPPEDGEYKLQLQYRDEARDSWGPARLPGGGAGLGAAGGDTHTFEGLVPGRYRALDRRSQTASAPVDVSSGGRTLELTLDLSGSVWVEGRIEAPAGTKLVQARVFVEGRDDTSRLWTGVRPAADGTFRVRGTRGRRMTLRVVHPTLTPARIGGQASVEAGRGEVVLRLEAGPELRFRAAGFEDAQTPDSGLWHAPLQVHLFPEGGGSGTGAAGAALTVQPVARGGVFRVGGYQPGTYTLWVTFGRAHAPLVRKGLALGAGSVDLGTLNPGPGSTLRVRVSGLDSKPGATIWVVVNHKGEPAYTRHGTLDRASGEIACPGLGRGTFRAIVRGAGLAAGAPGTKVLLERDVTLDGESDKVLEVRLP